MSFNYIYINHLKININQITTITLITLTKKMPVAFSRINASLLIHEPLQNGVKGITRDT